MSAVSVVGQRIANKLFKFAFPIYRPLYCAWKTHTDRVERRLLAGYLCDGSVVVDAGANIGIYSQFLSKCVGPNGVVHSFEPSSENFRRLCDTVANVRNVRLNQSAVADKTGELILYVSDRLNVDHRTYPTEGESRKTVSVHSTTLDDYFKPGERVDLIKMDIQGYELHALRGAQRVICENRTIKLLLEFWPYGLKRAGQSWNELIRLLESHGMAIQLVAKDGLKPLRAASIRDTAEWYVNLFAERTMYT
jgi:FkbM family methyltransferase